MKKITVLLSTFFFLFVVQSSAKATNSPYCDFSPTGAEGQPYGDVTLSSTCVIYEQVNGVAEGNLTLNNAIITLNSTLIFAPGKQINIQGDSIVYLNTGGKIEQAKLCIKDADHDQYADTITLTTDPATGLTISSPITQIQKIAADPVTGQCPDASWTYSEGMNNLTLVDANPNTTDITKIATSDRELLRLGFTVAGITDAYAAAGDIQIIGKNLLVCNGTSCPTVSFATDSGNIYLGARIGVGKTNPAYPMDINGTLNATALYVNGSPYIGSQWTTTGSDIYYTTGKVGIGITNPGASLSITRGTGGDGTLKISGTTNASHFNYSTAEDTYIRGGKTTSAVYINDNASGNVTLAVGGGSVGIGVTNPAVKLDVAGGINSSGNAGLVFSSWGGGWLMSDTTWIRSSGGKPVFMSAGFDTTSASGVGGNGSLGGGYTFRVYGSVYAGGSSREYKTNIEPLTLDPSKIYQLEPVSFDYKPEWSRFNKDLSGGREFGLIAQDVAKVYPELALTLTVNGVKKISNVDYEKLPVLLLAEMKNQKKEIDSLKQEVEDLKQRLIQIESILK